VTRSLLILRPEPGNAATTAKAAARDIAAHSFPLFVTEPVHWAAPDPERYVGVIMTSANAARLAGPELARFTHLPLYAVGDVTGDAARDAGFVSIISGDGDVDRLLAKIATLGLHRLLHLAGADFHPFEPFGVEIERQIVYASKPVAPPPELLVALSDRPVAMLHSARAAAQFAVVVDGAKIDRSQIALAVISANAAEAAGGGWESVAVAAQPRDNALLELAARLCKNGRVGA
jgi:uroporphyrinogen-III synthase